MWRDVWVEEEANWNANPSSGVDEGGGRGTPEGSKGKISPTRLKEASALSQTDKL